MKKKPVIIGMIVLMVAAGAAAFAYYKNIHEKNEGFPVEAAVVTKKTIEGSVTNMGKVELQKLETIAAETQAKILSVNVKVGDVVKAGDILIEYDPKSKEKLEDSLLEAELALRSAELTLRGASLPASAREIASYEAEVSLRKKNTADAKYAIERMDITINGVSESLESARSDYEIRQTLFEAGAISKAELDAAADRISELELTLKNNLKNREALTNDLEASLEAEKAAEHSLELIKSKTDDPAVQNQISLAEVSVEQQRLRIKQIKKQLDEFKLVEVSPIDGDVINVFVENGYVTQAGDRLLNLGDTNKLIIVTEIVEYDVPGIAVGQSVELTGDVLRDQKLMGEVTSIAPSAAPKQVGNATGNVVKTEIGLVEENTVLRPGFSVTTKILTANHEDAETVPLLSLLYDKNGEYSVFVINENNILERKRVTVIAFAALDAVVEGVKEGERVVASPSSDLEEGIVVSVND